MAMLSFCLWMVVLSVAEVLSDESVSDNNVNNVTIAPSVLASDPPTSFPTGQPSKAHSDETTTTSNGCISNLNDLAFIMLDKDPFTPETFTLCPNTKFPVGTRGGDVGDFICCADGQAPIYPRSNTLIKCGDDGAKENNCTIVGGQWQVFADAAVFGEPLRGFRVQGVTFADAFNIGALHANAGDTTYEDCVFRDHANRGAVNMLYIPPEDPERRKLELELDGLDFPHRVGRLMLHYAETLEKRGGHEKGQLASMDPRDKEDSQSSGRKLQDTSRQEVSLINCTFEGNKLGPSSTTTQFGVVSAYNGFSDVYLEGALFIGNDFGGGPNGYAVSARDGCNLEIFNSCFINNSFAGSGTVQVIGDAGFVEKGNYGTEDNGVRCQFLSFSEDPDSKPTCIPYDVDSCSESTCTSVCSPSSVDARFDRFWRLTVAGVLAVLLFLA